MKLSTPCIVALISLGLAAQARAASPSPSSSQSPTVQTMPLDEIARRLIRQQNQIDCFLPGLRGLPGIGVPTSMKCTGDDVPTRVTFASVQVNTQGTDNFVVDAKFTVRGYYRDSTTVNDKDQQLLLSKERGGWKIQTDSAKFISGRHEAQSAAPAPGETNVAGAVPPAAQADTRRPAAATGRGGAVPLGEYNCVASAGGQLVHVGGFTLQAGGVYHDEDNGRGTYVYDSNQHQITFQGAAMSGQVGIYTGSTFTLKSQRNSVDCDRDN